MKKTFLKIASILALSLIGFSCEKKSNPTPVVVVPDCEKYNTCEIQVANTLDSDFYIYDNMNYIGRANAGKGLIVDGITVGQHTIRIVKCTDPSVSAEETFELEQCEEFLITL